MPLAHPVFTLAIMRSVFSLAAVLATLCITAVSAVPLELTKRALDPKHYCGEWHIGQTEAWSHFAYQLNDMTPKADKDAHNLKSWGNEVTILRNPKDLATGEHYVFAAFVDKYQVLSIGTMPSSIKGVPAPIWRQFRYKIDLGAKGSRYYWSTLGTVANGDAQCWSAVDFRFTDVTGITVQYKE